MLAQDRASYILEMDEWDRRKGSYCNLPTKKEVELEQRRIQNQKEDIIMWKKDILPRLIQEAEYVTKRKLVQRTVPPWE